MLTHAAPTLYWQLKLAKQFKLGPIESVIANSSDTRRVIVFCRRSHILEKLANRKL